MSESISKHDEYVDKAREVCAYVDTKTKTIGVYCEVEDMKRANKNFFVDKLRNKFKYKIQMVIK